LQITVFLPKEHVVLGLRGADRRAILRALSAPLVEEQTVTDANVFLDELEAREQQITTQMTGGVAFPHARSQAVKRLALTVGLASAPGLAFSAADREPCRLFFLIAVPPAAPTAHLPLLRYLSAFVRQDRQVGRLLEAHTSLQVVRLLAALKR
jgi:mannitol/fructose-specific phosphotransferase system IIA component (Ntr-type)